MTNTNANTDPRARLAIIIQASKLLGSTGMSIYNDYAGSILAAYTLSEEDFATELSTIENVLMFSAKNAMTFDKDKEAALKLLSR